MGHDLLSLQAVTEHCLSLPGIIPGRGPEVRDAGLVDASAVSYDSMYKTLNYQSMRP